MNRARRGSLGALLLTLAAGAAPATRARAQERPEPQLLLTIFGGAASGATFYSGLRQPLPLFEDPAAIDTLALGRRLASGILIGASTTWFPTPSFGLSAEIVFLGPGLDDDCAVVHTAPSPARAGYNEQICNDIAATGRSASAIGFYLGGLFRVAPRGSVKPYVRAQAGFAVRGGSTVELTGRFLDGAGLTRNRLIIEDPDRGSISATASFGAGIMVPFAPGYQARLEFRDHLLSGERVTGPADALAQTQTERFLVNTVGLVLMLDVVLEQKRGRRY
jgi:hypothetical protein